MTLILTHISSCGIAMAADSAVTMSDQKVETGVKKLFGIKSLNVGVSVWGAGTINGEDTDKWLENIVLKLSGTTISLDAVAQEFSDRLNIAFAKIPIESRPNMGLHVAGYINVGLFKRPAVFHVHNQHRHTEFRNGAPCWVEDGRKTDFEPHLDYCLINLDDWGVLRNGDIPIFAILSDAQTNILQQLQHLGGFKFPESSSLRSRGEYVYYLIRTISEMYKRSNFNKMGMAAIDGSIRVLTISEHEIESFYDKSFLEHETQLAPL